MCTCLATQHKPKKITETNFKAIKPIKFNKNSQIQKHLLSWLCDLHMGKSTSQNSSAYKRALEDDLLEKEVKEKSENFLKDDGKDQTEDDGISKWYNGHPPPGRQQQR